MTVIERMARAMAAADGKDPDDPAWIVYPGGHPKGICWRDLYDTKARAALEALREPSMAMKLAGAEKITAQMTGSGPPADYDAACDAWSAMIDAALKESVS